jgi:hypothetical protein
VPGTSNTAASSALDPSRTGVSAVALSERSVLVILAADRRLYARGGIRDGYPEGDFWHSIPSPRLQALAGELLPIADSTEK